MFQISKLGFPIFALLFFVLPILPTLANLEIVQPATDTFVFAGRGRQVEVVFRNTSTDDFVAPVSTRMFQASSATLAPVGSEQDWKKLHVLAGQTIIENAAFDFPEVRALTAFQIRWFNDRHEEIGKTTVHVLPTNVLAQVSVLTSNTAVGLIDPNDTLKGPLKKSGVKCHELSAEKPFANFAGKLVLVSASADLQIVDAGLKAGAKHPLIIVWMRDLKQPIGALPNMYFVRSGQAEVAVVDATLFTDLEHSVVAQINLLRCIKTAQHPEKLQLPTADKP